MTDEAPKPEAHDDDHGRMVRLYLTVFIALAVFTLLSFVANFAAADERHWISKGFSFLIILGVAVVKACLVGYVFMHLMGDWRKLYFMIFPAFILGAMMMFVLMPDIVLAWQR
ncbi:MAG TPA: cytochrome C oxidase subunit IV family protein [Gemmataceae bacterium]|nr:cytochrome C oxidase subunit IV family protein [Gemmataceae bacterium]